jgi:hypothetical protein
MAFFATPVIAHETDVPHAETVAQVDAEVSAESSVDTMRPLDYIKARAQQIKNTNAPASTGTRPVMPARSASDQQRASSTMPQRDLKALALLHGGVIKNRFRLAISHLNNLLDRIDSRITKMTDAGLDTAAVVSLKIEADLAVSNAEADATAAADFAATANDATDRAAFKAELAAKIRAAHASMKAAHKAVMDVVRALVQLAKDNKPKVDSGASVETPVEAETDVQ